MAFTQFRSLLVVGVTALILAGCASNEPEDSAPVVQPETEAPETNVREAVQDSAESVKPTVNSGNLVIPTLDGLGTETLQGVFYFDFDQAIVKRAGHAELNKHATALAGDPLLQVRLEGHADERGTREYNLALGERRANAVRAYLVAQGASRSQVEVVSFGEEDPADAGHNEAAWAKNRRVEVIYR